MTPDTRNPVSMTPDTRDPLTMMLDIAERFIEQAKRLDDDVVAAADADADRTDIVALMSLADTSRLRALAAAAQAAPYCRPKQAAVIVDQHTEVEVTHVSRLEHTLNEMDEQRVLALLDRMKASRLQQLDHLKGDADAPA